MAKKKKGVLKKKIKKSSPRKVSHELVVRVQPQTFTLSQPTTKDLVEPLKDGKKMALTPTWISSAQLIKIVQETPKQHIYTRPGKGGSRFSYVTGNYVTKVLNFVFGWNWDFEVVDHGIQGTQVWVKGKLTVKGNKGETIAKSQFGRADIKFLKGSKEMLDFGNDLKAATTDSLKKCASMLGIASDIYGKTEYKEETGIEVSLVNKKEAVPGPDGDPVFLCQVGDEPVTLQEAEFSKKIYGKVLCREHQTNAKRK